MKITNLQSTIVTPKEQDVELVISSLASTTDAVAQINTDLLIDYEGQPFKPYTEEKLLDLAEDIKINGVLSPIIVRPVEDGKYQILAGHNRTAASKLAGLSAVPAIIKPCDDDTAKLIVVNTNLNQRQELLPSEKAFAYKMQMEAMKRQAGRPKNNSSQLETNLRSDDIIAEKSSDSRAQIQRYIRLTYLIKPLLEMVDNNKMKFMVGVNLSFLSRVNQDVLFDYLTENKRKVTLSQSEELKRLNLLGSFSFDMLDDFYNIPKEEIKTKKQKYLVKLTSSQYKTILLCIKNQKDSIAPEIYETLVKLFDNV